MTDRDRDFERVFVGDYQRQMTHFYSIGTKEGSAETIERFAYGYFTPDGYFHTGIAEWDRTQSSFVR